jgi:hypothetical protein
MIPIRRASALGSPVSSGAKSSSSNARASAWSVSLVSFPFVALPAYLVFGRNKFEGMVEAYAARQEEVDALVAQVQRNVEPWTVEAETRPSVYNAVRQLTGRDFRAYGKEYIEQTKTFRTTSKPRFTDKLPNNFSHVGFAHLILPNAKIINARRHPLDSILGSYKQLFGKGQNFTYDMDELVLYYRQYHEIMKHWHRVLPGKVLDVHYEETVGDLESQVRRILAHCGLPFEEACLRFHETNRAVRTASSEQVRQPLYTRALGTWRRYEKHLAPLRDILARNGVEGLD